MSRSSVIFVTGSYDESVRFWNFETGECYHMIKLKRDPGMAYKEKAYNDPDVIATHVNRLEITPDKQYVAAATFPSIEIYGLDGADSKPVTRFKGHTETVTAVGFQKAGKWMYSGSEDGTVKLWDRRVRNPVQDFGSGAPINSVVLHPNERELISADQNGGVRIWDLAASTCSCEMIPEADTALRSLAVTSGGKLLVAASDSGACYLWQLKSDVQTAASYEPLHKLQAHGGCILKCVFSPESLEPNRYLVTASSDRTAKVWNLRDFNLEKTLAGHTRWVWDSVFTSDGTSLATVSSDCTGRKWASSTWETTRYYKGHAGVVNCCALREI